LRDRFAPFTDLGFDRDYLSNSKYPCQRSGHPVPFNPPYKLGVLKPNEAGLGDTAVRGENAFGRDRASVDKVLK
jgi:hypothetical protein